MEFWHLFVVYILMCHFVLQGDCLHVKGSWNTKGFFKFLAKFGVQQTNLNDKLNTQGYIYGNITSKGNFTTDVTFVVVDSEYFIEFYGNRSKMPRNAACPAMFSKIDSVAWDYPCNLKGWEDFLRKVPCPAGRLCADEDEPSRVVPRAQFTYGIQDIKQPRFWYISLVSCYHNSTNRSACQWQNNPTQDITIDYDIWLVNGNPFTRHVNPFEHQFSFEMHDVFEIHLVFLVLYSALVPIQLYSFSKQKHHLTRLLTACILMEYSGIICNFIHIFKFAFDGEGVWVLQLLGNIVGLIAECMLMLILLLLAKGWTITRLVLTNRSSALLFGVWGLYLLGSLGLFAWNLTEVDLISDTDEWQTWPGFLILALRVFIMIWFLIELREMFVLEKNRNKMEFYLHYGAGFLVWFVYLPILALICSQISALWRYKTLLSVTYAADVLSYMVLVHLLWPTRSHLYFSFSTPHGSISMKDFEFTGLGAGLLDDHDSTSEESFETKLWSRENSAANGRVFADKNGHSEAVSEADGTSTTQM